MSVGLGVGVIVGVGVGVEVGNVGVFGIWIAYEVDGASGFWALRIGMKVTVPRFKSYLKSCIVRLMA